MTEHVWLNIHPNSELARLWTDRITGHSVREMKLSLVALYGPFPLMFATPQHPNHGHSGPGVVITGLIELPGEMQRQRDGVPFHGASAVGYVPAIGHDGVAVRPLGSIKGERWDEIHPPAEMASRVPAPAFEVDRTRAELPEPPNELPHGIEER